VDVSYVYEVQSRHLQALPELEDEYNGHRLEGHAVQVDIVDQVEVDRPGMGSRDIFSVKPKVTAANVKRLLDRVPAREGSRC